MREWLLESPAIPVCHVKNKPKVGVWRRSVKVQPFWVFFVSEFGLAAGEKPVWVLSTEVMKCLFMVLRLSPLLLISPVDFTRLPEADGN